MTTGTGLARVVLVDDDPFILKVLARQLKSLGIEQVNAFERAEEALGLLESGLDVVDLVLCDLQMPDIDGVQFVRQLARIGYAGGVVLVSGEDERVLQMAQRLARAHKLRVLGTLAKPVRPADLRRILALYCAPWRAPAHPVRAVYGPGELRRAIAEAELVNYYQPKVALASGAIEGVETLVRWKHPRDGLVLPDHFIPMAEAHGLIDDLTFCVMREALRQARRWSDVGLELNVAVNVSMDSLVSLDFPDLVACEIERAGVPASSLTLEVTESRLMRDPRAALDILTRLRLKRVRLSIDDFGTGYSSLAQVRDLPFDELKIDRGFVHRAGADATLRAIFEASLGMARQLGLVTVAEGVEDEADWEFLRAAGCDLAQGYFVARPMPAPALAGWISDWSARQWGQQARVA
jgi:EAL domain-containing protein (putative c-di-GMP-specific phosphodiesterase class I)/ActR/RegA family two-component response regulator